MSARAFLERYAERSGTTAEDILERGRVVVPCDCDWEYCGGWALVPGYDLEPWQVPADLSIGSEVVPWCGHGCAVGAEGSIADLGRWPVLWECLLCGHVFVEVYG
ncbi:hypothetical protein SEA_ORCANUS_61 [Arthrobacter phage Orcanus]|nr:hypothetical protein SEA_ORCANUS_61 [Arthrobacter phage Orcanus]